ncbi:MBL fold metallo-hydrolase [Chryseobacterium sp. EO14]|uniref:MBL fold metallo-hydrolase n=1 Tax=Chryseobacterium sp. EO14 TaxID=2950551 RepID=UPI00210E3146|nr:MBL fold metallo-hydrolase [Chryseobacterium sp. EO14]MCQ4139973.1 MBL fold metallo-hydrolase [Chryseobacterium sp. EO14]
MANIYKVVTSVYAEIFKSVSDDVGKSKNNTVLMGSYVKILDEETENWQKVIAFGKEGWIRKDKLGDSPDFKCFFVDVGQGDGALIEIGNDKTGLKILIDGGPSDNLSRYLSKWQYKYYFDNDKTVHFDYIFISHFDKDHYNGLIDIINDPHYTIGTIYHNGIAKFNNEKTSFPSMVYNTELGKKIKKNNNDYLITQFDSLAELNDLQMKGGMLNLLEKFTSAVNNAKQQGRLKNFMRLDHTKTIPGKLINNKEFSIDVLGPVLSQTDEGFAFKYFKDEAHTINGHSLVLKLKFGDRTFLFGGDLNIPAENHLLEHYQANNPFEADVAKSCHHGASEFTTEFMAQINPFATVISSGDNESYSHPRADAIGCAGKYTRSARPLVFSTELARSSNVKTNEIKYGMINLRSNGKDIIMAQMKEVVTGGNPWDLYEVK